MLRGHQAEAVHEAQHVGWPLSYCMDEAPV
jgi:hypothetical protein